MPYEEDDIDEPGMDPGPYCTICGADSQEECEENGCNGHTRKRGCPKCSQPISQCGCELDGEEPIDGVGFADHGGESALRAATCFNPRDRPCPSCHRPGMLTRIDVRRGYQCDYCATATEQGLDIDWVCNGAKGGCLICKENEEE